MITCEEYQRNIHDIESVFTIEGEGVTLVCGIESSTGRWVDVLLMNESYTMYEIPQGIHIQADTVANIVDGDDEYQEFSYIEIGGRTFIYEENYLGLCLDEMELVHNGPYVGCKMID